MMTDSFDFVISFKKVFNKKDDVKNLHCFLRRRPEEVRDIAFSWISAVAALSVSTFCFLV
jgi:hypothetical protein